jgi:hypothetical protein
MIEDLLGDKCALSTGLVADGASLGYTERASVLLGVSSSSNEPTARESQEDFFRAVQILEGESAVRPLRAVNERFRFVPVYVSCPLDTWTAVFGKAEPVIQYHKTPMRLPVQVWERRCTDGAAACVGHIYERSAGLQWVVLARVIFF